MAKEISTNISVSISPSGANKTTGQTQTQEDLAGNATGFEATVGFTSAAGISLGTGITSPKVIYIQNMDTSNFVVVDNVIGLTNWPQKILPGAAVFLRPEGTAIFAKADTAPVDVWIVAG